MSAVQIRYLVDAARRTLIIDQLEAELRDAQKERKRLVNQLYRMRLDRDLWKQRAKAKAIRGRRRTA